eukprot:8743535-Pyramimonas_sp.AAC.1
MVGRLGVKVLYPKGLRKGLGHPRIGDPGLGCGGLCFVGSVFRVRSATRLCGLGQNKGAAR